VTLKIADHIIMKNRTYLRGFYGLKNIGDDVFCIVMDWAAKNIFGLTHIYLHGHDLPRMRNMNGIPYLKWRMFPFMQVRIEALRSRNIIHAGGSTFARAAVSLLDERNLFRYRQLFALGISIGPFKTEQDFIYIKEYLKRFKYISLRDNRSIQYATEMGLKYNTYRGFDIAALLPLIVKDPDYYTAPAMQIHNGQKKVVGISVCNYEKFVNGDSRKESNRINSLLRMIRLINSIDPSTAFRFFIFNGHNNIGDMPLTQHVISCLGEAFDVSIVDYTERTLDFWNEMRKCDLFMGFRLHSGIMSYMAGIPFILFEYHEKCTDFLSTINYNHEYRVNNLTKIRDEELKSKLHALLYEKNLCLTTFSPEQATNIVLQNFRECAKILNGV
jgi:polysaccharide pyruvyl transferase WcaK-like protein